MTFDRADVAETHASVVFFMGDRAYKVKKPVALGFLDFTTREAREAVCRREVELNRRLSPDVYLGVSDVLDVDGAVCDHLVVMRRMPADRRLGTLVRNRVATEEQIDAIARVLAAFHAGADGGAHIDTSATVEAVRANWSQSFAQMQRFTGTVLPEAAAERVETLALRYLAGRGELFARRIAEGRIRDGHGDLLADDIFVLDDGPRILDCIEFNDRFRYGDVLNDVAFLAMDLEFSGAPELARHLLDRWAELTAETHPASLAHHYVAYRAHVRSKVACLRADQGDAFAADDAARHLVLALEHLERGRVALVVVGGLPGTGKSTLAEGFGAELGWLVLRSDAVRKELAGITSETPAAADYRGGIYSADATERTYAELLRRARRALELGESVVIDASWTSAHQRAEAAQIASATDSELFELRCTVPDDVAAYRMRTRTRPFGSDATPTIAAAMAVAADPWPSAHSVDTDRPSAAVLADGLEQLAPSGP
ncbi:MAG: AAA family ATPase [Actinomycetota bacterium]|nr:AAA family ATPase [Actinomycetota bacterium]